MRLSFRLLWPYDKNHLQVTMFTQSLRTKKQRTTGGRGECLNCSTSVNMKRASGWHSPWWPGQSGGWWHAQRSGSPSPRCPPPHGPHPGTGAFCGWRTGWQWGQSCACGWAPTGRRAPAPGGGRSCPPRTTPENFQRVHGGAKQTAADTDCDIPCDSLVAQSV